MVWNRHESQNRINSYPGMKYRHYGMKWILKGMNCFMWYETRCISYELRSGWYEMKTNGMSSYHTWKWGLFHTVYTLFHTKYGMNFSHVFSWCMATPVNTYWRDQGLDHLTSTVSTTPMPGPPSCQLLPKTQKNPPLTPTACDFFPASLSCFGSVRDFFFLPRALHLEDCCFRFCISLCLCLEG